MFAHSKRELRGHKTQTVPCADFWMVSFFPFLPLSPFSPGSMTKAPVQKGACPHGAQCRFAHSLKKSRLSREGRAMARFVRWRRRCRLRVFEALACGERFE